MKLAGTNWLVYVGILTHPTTEWNQREFYIYVPELSPFHDGDLTPEYVEVPISIKNLATGGNECKDIKVTKTIKADYFGLDSSKSVPTMAKGQQVLVLNFANSGRYYWIPLERDDHLKTFERVRWSCADIATTNKVPDAEPRDIKAKKDGLTDDNTYFFEIDTRDKKIIRMATAASDGESWRYYFHIDPEERAITIWDEHVDENANPKQLPNTIKLESRPTDSIIGRITLQNASGTTLKLEDKNLIISVPGNMLVDVKGDVLTNIEGSNSTKIGVDNNLTILNNNAVMIGGNNAVSIGGDDGLNVEGNKTENVNKNRTSTTTETLSETQKVRLSNTATNEVWKTLTWQLDAQVSMVANTITQTMNATTSTIVTQNFTHTASNAVVKFSNFRNILIRDPESDDPIPLSKIL